MPKLNMVQAINLALDEAMADDADVVVLGEDVGVDGGVFRVTDGLHEKYGEARVIDTPLAESGIIGTAIGMAMAGLRPVGEMQFSGFSYLMIPSSRVTPRACARAPRASSPCPWSCVCPTAAACAPWSTTARAVRSTMRTRRA